MHIINQQCAELKPHSAQPTSLYPKNVYISGCGLREINWLATDCLDMSEIYIGTMRLNKVSISIISPAMCECVYVCLNSYGCRDLIKSRAPRQTLDQHRARCTTNNTPSRNWFAVCPPAPPRLHQQSKHAYYKNTHTLIREKTFVFVLHVIIIIITIET